MKINTDKLAFKVSLDTDDINKIIDRYEQDNALLIVEKGSAPWLFIDGENYPVTYLSYQYLTDTDKQGVNIVVAEYIDGTTVKSIEFNNNTGEVTEANKYHLGEC